MQMHTDEVTPLGMNQQRKRKKKIFKALNQRQTEEQKLSVWCGCNDVGMVKKEKKKKNRPRLSAKWNEGKIDDWQHVLWIGTEAWVLDPDYGEASIWILFF